MDSNDRNLGMNSRITRRDFLNGVAVTIGTSLIPGVASGQNVPSQGITQDTETARPIK